ncbi:MAG: RnfABCDGE type electron transport complex subunit D [Alphaproteobacteria bacterium]|nr:RnfABCDGE type electron transport complex subunit D [Alphaproteobacteria bacterium]
MTLAATFSKDPRHAQIVTLSLLMVLGAAWLDFGPEPYQLFIALSATLLTQYACFRMWGISNMDFRSPFITGLGITLLLRSDALWMYALAGFLAIASKFLIRVNNKHMFNPANFAIALLLLALPDMVWVAPGQWGATGWLGILVLCAGMMVITGARRIDTTLMFFACFGGLLLARALYLGDPLEIPLHQMESVSLLIFAFFMISDPVSTPSRLPMRFLFVLLVSLLAFYLQFKLQIRPGLILALFFISPLTPLLDLMMKGANYSWKKEPTAS